MTTGQTATKPIYAIINQDLKIIEKFYRHVVANNLLPHYKKIYIGDTLKVITLEHLEKLKEMRK